MDDILTYLEDITQPDSLGPEHAALTKKVCELEKALLAAIPLSYLDALTEAQSEVLRFERRECFSRGFRLGIRLTLSALE